MSKDTSVRIENDNFQKFRDNMNKILKSTLRTMQEKDSESATISVRFDVSLKPGYAPDTQLQYPNAEREIIEPKFGHKIKSVIQLKDDVDGSDGGKGYELIWDSELGKFFMRPVGAQQVSLFDEAEDLLPDEADETQEADSEDANDEDVTEDDE